jgi:hypothetical protein
MRRQNFLIFARQMSSRRALDHSSTPPRPHAIALPQPGVLFWRLFLAQQQVLGLGPQPESLRSEALLIGRRRRRHRPQHTRSREGPDEGRFG